MRKGFFYIGVALLVFFEAANVYFIMPFPGSQRMQSVHFAFFLHSWRWVFRVLFAAIAIAGVLPAFRERGRKKIVPALVLAVGAAAVFMINGKMQADKIFIAPSSVVMRPAGESVVDSTALVVGVEINGEARAYPLRYIGYHHQVRDSVGGQPVLVSYCTVCRTGRVFSPVVDGAVEHFRLVGMDHFNAMFEDRTTKSWWRQVNGIAAVGDAKGKTLPELRSQQMPLRQWLALHPGSLIMQPDSALEHRYPRDYAFETGESRGKLTGTDTVSWNDKAWVVGITIAGQSKAYDWQRLKRERVINDVVGGRPIVVALAVDSATFFALERPDSATHFVLRGDSLAGPRGSYSLSGRGSAGALRAVSASQEFWHSWRTFNPGTLRY